MTGPGGKILPSILISLLIIMLLIPPLPAGTVPEQDKPADEQADTCIEILHWLLLGPFDSPFPAFHDEGDKKLDQSDILTCRDMPLDRMLPAAGKEELLLFDRKAAWITVEADTNGVSIPAPNGLPHTAFLAVYMEVPRWMKVDLECISTHPFEVFVDGVSLMKAAKIKTEGVLDNRKSAAVKLERGKHLVLAKTVYVPGDSLVDWRFAATVDPGVGETPLLSTGPERTVSTGDILAVPGIGQVAVSPDGKLVAYIIRRLVSSKGDREQIVEIRSMKDGGLVRTIRDIQGLSGLQWATVGQKLSYRVTSKEKGSIRMLDTATGTTETIIEGIKNLGGYDWGPDGSFIIYSVTEKPKKTKTGVKRHRGIRDRWSGGRNRSFLYLSSVPGGFTRRMTAGRHDTYVHDIHPGGGSVLISRSYEELSERPYGASELLLMNLETQESELLVKAPWLGSASWSPDGKKILILGGPSTFGDLGINMPGGAIPNEYDTQAYIFDPATKTAEAITRDFTPSISRAMWSHADGNIYIIAGETSYQKIFRYNPKKMSFKALPLGFDYVSGGDMALNRPVAALVGMGTAHSSRLYSLDLRRGKPRMILDPSDEIFRDIRFGKVEDWNFRTDGGTLITGRIHYPPDFDPSREYPCIVYYYGGTSPTFRTFGGRYPKCLWASMGYVVYILQPSGATGFGQEFSSKHVNDWGTVVAGEIIEGVTKFLDAHPFVDRDRVGCIGASYGGFMTQLLATKTDIFAAAVSHAGISSITSYWGKGYWGYGYNAVAAANSFPWNRRDIYVDQSPIFAADRINTPLLLLHGASDTNVPPGESHQMYIALKLLGRSVELITFEGQSHFILDYEKRIAWSNAIVAWFDRWLKDQPEWWNDMYPPPGGEKAEPGGIGMHRAELERYGTVLLGEITRENITEHLNDWDSEYFEYTPDEALLPELMELIHDTGITVVMGTWCSDSKREIPRLWKILEEIGFPLSGIRMLAVGSSRFTADMPVPPGVLQWSTDIRTWYGIERVATIIVKRGNKELGRIVETPEGSLEEDLLEILKK